MARYGLLYDVATETQRLVCDHTFEVCDLPKDHVWVLHRGEDGDVLAGDGSQTLASARMLAQVKEGDGQQFVFVGEEEAPIGFAQYLMQNTQTLLPVDVQGSTGQHYFPLAEEEGKQHYGGKHSGSQVAIPQPVFERLVPEDETFQP
eukprot:4036268-Amphidinium_carterae.1